MGWAFIGSASTSVAGSDKEVQFNDAGTLAGDADFTWNKTTNLLRVTGAVSASTTITAASFYGDGRNLTGLTASAVNVAEGPEFSLQFRVNNPVEGEISGSHNLMFLTGSTDTLSLTGTLDIKGNAIIGNGFGGGHIFVKGDPDTKISFGTAGSDSMDFTVGGKRLIRLDENGDDVVILGSATTDRIYTSGSLSASSGLSASFAILHPTSGTLAGPGSYLALDANNNVVVSAGDGATTAAAGSDKQIQFNDGGSAFGADADFTWNKTSNLLSVTGAIEISGNANDAIGDIRFADSNASLGLRHLPPSDGSAKYLQLAYGLNGAKLFLTASDGIEMMTNSTQGVGLFGAPLIVYTDESGDTNAVTLTTAGEVSASANISGSNVFVPSGNSVFFNPNETFKITNNGTNLDINGTSVILNAVNKVSASANTLAPSLTSSYTQLGEVSAHKTTVLSQLTASTGLSASFAILDYTSGSAAGPGSYLVLDATNKVVVSTVPDVTTAAGSDTQIQFNDGGTAFGGDADFTWNKTSNLLSVTGAIEVSSSIYDAIGGMRFGTQNASLGLRDAGGDTFFQLAHGTDGGKIFITASAGIELMTEGQAGIGSFGSPVFVYTNSDADGTAVVLTNSGSIGINNAAPVGALDVYHTGGVDPTNLGNDTGGGDVVFFGTASANLTAGGLYYLNTYGGWASANAADSVAGNDQLLAIALGSKPGNNGMLVKGFFDAHTHLSGAFIKGGPVYIQSSSIARADQDPGFISQSAPTAANSYVRVIGYGTDTANVIYFCPDSTYVEIA